MRLPLAWVAAAMAWGCAGGPAHQATSRVHFYNDERVAVVSPAVRDEVEIRDSRVAVDYAVDVVSGATQALTVDAVSSATRFSERRHQAGVMGAHAFSPETELSGGYTFSVEPDHVVHAPSLGLTRELLERTARASVRYQLVLESIGRVNDPAFAERARGHRVDLGWTQIATKTLVVTALATATAYDCGAAIGCFANPYRFVGIDVGEGARLAFIERHPATRFTGAGALRLSWALGDATALHAGYRFSGDSWGVTAHTADTAFVDEMFARRLLARAEARATVQRAASFYRARYLGDGMTVPAFRTGDSELSALWSVRLQLHLEWAWGPARIVGEFGRMWNEYPDFKALPTRHAWTGGLGIDAEF